MLTFLHLRCLLQWKTWRRFFPRSYLKAYHFFLYILGQNAASPSTTADRLERLPVAAFPGSTAMFFRLQPGIILKAPVKMGEDQIIRERHNVAKHFIIEEQIFVRLGAHRRILRLLGSRAEFPTGLLLAEANRGNLESFLHEHNDSIPYSLRRKWFFQAIESIEFIHSRGVIHSDLRPENFLVHGSLPDSLDLWLCDFGGSTCKELGISTGKLPDSGFFNPALPWEPTFAIDIFSLGSVLYTIMEGHWPFRVGGGRFTSAEEMGQYEATADANFCNGIFPSLETLFGGEIIRGCWTGNFSQATEVMTAATKLEL